MHKLFGFGLAGATGITVTLLGVSCGSTEVTCEDLATCARTNGGPDGGTDSGTDSGTDAALEAEASRPPDAPDGGDAPESDAPEGDASTEVDGEDRSEADVGCRSTLPAEAGPCLEDTLAVFVSPLGNDAGTGRRGSEFRTLAAALRAAKGGFRRIYVCDNGTGYPEPLAIDVTVDAALDGLELYGGFECERWTYSVDRRARVQPRSGPALRLKGLVVGARLANLDLASTNAEAPGSSSFGAIIENAMNVVLDHAKITAGNGAPGSAGANGVAGVDGALVSPQQQQGAAAICPSNLTMQAGGAWSGPSQCGSQGGSGGPANRGTIGYRGLPGLPGPDNGGAEGGSDGVRGANGAPGNAGAAALSTGSFSVAGFTPSPAGADGTDGSVGQGGGGGGASHAPAGNCIGASGGVGGMGGCAGKKGLGGGGGGASVGLLSWTSVITLVSCEIAAGNGGAGGPGGNGGSGGLGRPGAPGGLALASDAGQTIGKGGQGGPGGDGGVGGSGAGGNGGPSYAFVYKGDSPSKNVGTLVTRGTGGVGGLGGRSNVKAADGSVGDAANERQVN